jgi:hypothetical protein
MPTSDGSEGPTAPSVIVSGGAYRAMTAGGGGTWLCAHVHFTQQSARSCADEHVGKLAKAAGAARAV